MSAKSFQAWVIQDTMKALMRHLRYVRITKGGSEKSRNYAHVFVPGALYGGKRGTMLCKRPWWQTHVYKSTELLSELCPQCQDRLRKLASIAAGAHPQRLFDAASGANLVEIQIEAEEMREYLNLLGQRQAEAAAAQMQLELPAELLPVGTGEGTYPWGKPPEASQKKPGSFQYV